MNRGLSRLLWALLKGMEHLAQLLYEFSIYLIKAARAATARLHATAQTMPHPRAYFWTRFGPAAAGIVLLLALPAIAVATTAQPSPVSAAAVASASSDPSTYSAAETASSTPEPAPASPTAEPTPAADSPAPVAVPAIQTSAGGHVVAAGGALLPNRARTPGATNPAVSQGNIGQTVCVAGWTATIRPPSTFTTSLKVRQLASGYSYNGDTATGDYEEDHLISLELGGAPAAEANLWPEPYTAAEGARVKDQVENKLHNLICSGAVSLTAAQDAIATDWWAAYQTYVGAAAAAPAPAAPQPVPAPAPAPAPAPGGGATALCNDGSLSFAAHHQGACSKHRGVSVFYR